MKKNLFTLTLMVILFGSCTIQKRLHMDGYYISWHGKGKNAVMSESSNDQQTSEIINPSSVPVNDVDLAISDSDLPSQPASVSSSTIEPNSDVNLNANPLKLPDYKVTRKQAKQALRELRKDAKEVLKEIKENGTYSGSVLTNPSIESHKSKPDTLLLVLICLVGFAPIAMYLYEDNQWTKRCTTNLILWLLCGLPGFIHALVVILGKK
jgi:uncharacterized membrane protein YqaE (UPF0057 family)